MLYPFPPSNFEAEAMALIKALEYINQLPGNECIQINTASLSCIKAVGNPNNVNPFIQNIKILTTASQKHDIHIIHVKAHSGIVGNELEDELAKRAAKTGQPIFNPRNKNINQNPIKKRSL